MEYKETAAQKAQNNMIGQLFFSGEDGEKMAVISPLHQEKDVMWFLTMNKKTGQKFRNEIKVFEV